MQLITLAIDAVYDTLSLKRSGVTCVVVRSMFTCIYYSVLPCHA